MKCRKQSHSMALFSPRVPTSRKVYPGRSRNTFVYWSFFVFTAGFERARAAPQAGQSKAPVGLLLAHGSHPVGMSTGVHAAGAAGFEKSRFFWPNACYPLRRSDCPIPCKGTDLQLSSCKIYLKLILSNTPARGQTKMPFSVFAQWRQKRAFFMEKSLSDVREKAMPPDAGLHSCTGGVFAVPLRGGPFQDGQRWVTLKWSSQHFRPLAGRT